MDKTRLQFLFQKYRTPEHIVRHMQKVAAVGLFLARKFHEQNIEVDEELVQYGSLLHDLVKIVDFSTVDESKFSKPPSTEDINFWNGLIEQYHNVKHCLAGYEVLMEEHEVSLALIVKKHGYNSLIAQNPEERPITLEEKIVYYADKRVRHDQVVTLAERIEDGQKRYFPDGNIPAEDKQVQQALFILEKELCEKASLSPENINNINIASFVPEIER